ncbi:rhodanese-like domain-containing protein [uncultured Shewanella sp.]|uniref:rhodanese-like domain-containing protein n=1 Tax=uncultured Shewanella sp. TaxID=173975 RepID=UPI00262B565A|nr:rhodanese-like domain-containing protein [uncultured Shewanella sp.]
MNKVVNLTLLCALLGLSAHANAYDAKLANSYHKQFSQATGKTVGKDIGLISAEGFVKQLQAKSDVMAIDIRTPEERQVFGLAVKDQLNISLNELFTPENLAKIPTDKPVVIVCKSGARAMAAGTALRQLGYGNVKVLKGGFSKLSSYVGPNIAN